MELMSRELGKNSGTHGSALLTGLGICIVQKAFIQGKLSCNSVRKALGVMCDVQQEQRLDHVGYIMGFIRARGPLRQSPFPLQNQKGGNAEQTIPLSLITAITADVGTLCIPRCYHQPTKHSSFQQTTPSYQSSTASPSKPLGSCPSF